ncbi:ThuA domain-containing protein [Rhodopirellula sp. MGV]|uniref:ThuA domain-containing protein n=1 Tax=Rhodopirellula sp. MGV TaxID=2023130 RepID=UPI000B96B7EA|nr:ThuA domain-containing protein [Rhodopirellula sp. MGV]OYP30445.1 hypothetical protein CGZ80_22620 [Rhodopirellula sp. MGV]PNY34790.1 hypothetical protein C2E31_21300 [Rhodopirellula baltica]
MNRTFRSFLSLSIACLIGVNAFAADQSLKVLLVAGGCCHDYKTQTQLLKSGIEKRIPSEVTIVYNPSNGTDARFDIYEKDDWAEGYDVVIHDECSASVTEKPYVARILATHENGVPAVNLHCAMHSYRWGDYGKPVEPGADNAGWYEMIGVQSTGHGPQQPIEINFDSGDHPILKGLKPWTTINEELYNNVQVFSGTSVLVRGEQILPPSRRALRDNPQAEPTKATAVVGWTNLYGPKETRIFSTSLGHQNGTVEDDRYLDFIARGVLWATGHISEDGTVDEAFTK